MTTVEGYWLLRRESRVDDAIYTVGARYDVRFGAWTIDGDVARQFGRFGGIDQRSGMLHFGGTFTAALPATPTFGAAFNLGHGDGATRTTACITPSTTCTR
ncbi:MAG: hypothetical protein O3A25_01395 [Acidobacteria bacterium]|nr:hypothetical protein [Acidobacteriota bacterium]